MDNIDIVAEFRAHMRRNGYSERTINAYVFDIKKLLDFDCNSDCYDLDSIKTIDKKRIRNWLDYCLEKGNTNKTLSRKIASNKAFFRFLGKEGYIHDDPSKDIDIPRTAKKAPVSLSQDEIKQLINAPCDNERDFLRNRAILMLLYSTGLRVSELVSLRIKDVSLDNNTLLIKGKGAKERILPLSSVCRRNLLEYLVEREGLFPETVFPKSFLFITRHKKQMTVRMIQYMVEKYGKRAGIMSHIHPHLLRHSIASHLVEDGCHIEAVRQTLGHEDLATTSIYLKTSQKFLSDEHKKHNPSNQLFKNIDSENNK